MYYQELPLELQEMELDYHQGLDLIETCLKVESPICDNEHDRFWIRHLKNDFDILYNDHIEHYPPYNTYLLIAYLSHYDPAEYKKSISPIPPIPRVLYSSTDFHVNDQVSFIFRGEKLVGKIIKLNPRTARITVADKRYTVPYTALEKGNTTLPKTVDSIINNIGEKTIDSFIQRTKELMLPEELTNADDALLWVICESESRYALLAYFLVQIIHRENTMLWLYVYQEFPQYRDYLILDSSLYQYDNHRQFFSHQRIKEILNSYTFTFAQVGKLVTALKPNHIEERIQNDLNEEYRQESYLEDNT